MTLVDRTDQADDRNTLTSKVDLGTDIDLLASAVERALKGADEVLAEAEKASWRVKRNAEDSAKRQLEKLRSQREKQKASIEPQIPDQTSDAPKEVDKPYTQLMEVCADAAKKGIAGKPEGLRVLKEMESLGIMPNSATYTSLMNVLAQAAAHKKAKLKDGFKLLTEMKERGLEPSVVTYTTLLALMVRACDNGEPVQLKDGYAILGEMEERQIRAERYIMATLMALISKLIKRGRASPADAEALMARATALKAVDATTYNNLLCAYGNALNATAGALSDGLQVRALQAEAAPCGRSMRGRRSSRGDRIGYKSVRAAARACAAGAGADAARRSAGGPVHVHHPARRLLNRHTLQQGASVCPAPPPVRACPRRLPCRGANQGERRPAP